MHARELRNYLRNSDEKCGMKSARGTRGERAPAEAAVIVRDQSKLHQAAASSSRVDPAGMN